MAITSRIIQRWHFIFISFCTYECEPFITLAVSGINAKAFEKSRPYFSKDSFKALKMFCAVPILTTSRKAYQESEFSLHGQEL